MSTRGLVGTAVGLALLLAGVGGTGQPRETLVARGEVLFTAHGCYGCHTVGKTGTPIAPDLSRVGSKHTVEYLARWLRDPSAQKPTAHMPRINLTDAEVGALAAYLASLR